MVPPYRIETDRVVIRCWDPRDAVLLKDAIDSSLDHLRPWMPWADANPQSLDENIDLLRGFRSAFDAGSDFLYGVFSADEQVVLGGAGLHPRVGDGALEIGYWIRRNAIGQGLATEVAAALTRVAFDVSEVERVEIHADPANLSSCRIPAKLGFRQEARLRRRLPRRLPDHPAPDVLIFSMVVEEFEGSPAGAIAAAVSACDSAGRSLIGADALPG
jgi:RimJ/RimL family protein N-acetyltransferase